MVLIINNPELLRGISGIYLKRDFTVFPFFTLEDVPDYLFSIENLFVWEVDEINPANLKWIEYLKEKKTIRFILIDFLNDPFLSHVLTNDYVPDDIYHKSYKIRDLISMSDMVFDEKLSFLNIGSYVSHTARIYARDLKQGENYLEMAERTIYQFLSEHQLENRVKDLDVFFLALGEVIENFVEYQLHKLKRNPSIVLEYGFDHEKIIISARDDLGKADFSALFKSFIRKTSLSPEEKQSLTDYNEKGVYVGSQGRGMSIIKKGVHRLISIVKRDPEEGFEDSEDRRTQFIFMVYLDKKETEKNSSVNMIVFF